MGWERFALRSFDHVEPKGFRMKNIVDVNLQGFKNLEGLIGTSRKFLPAPRNNKNSNCGEQEKASNKKFKQIYIKNIFN
jgi:hypothetical protein